MSKELTEFESGLITAVQEMVDVECGRKEVYRKVALLASITRKPLEKQYITHEEDLRNNLTKY
ncbi:hypothetical protein FCL40_14715 [Ferrimonas sediminicola]|uniref:Uncharacterized protein n=1 Tax=Ferrimonas sediminicola TaxID=2569538 RepID=A0A4U1BDG1_9GAMM|nr:hypothetical protein [Ferrimonas sediminicola]TKB47987.1 hypothetical protein FCL40_14715 [Ferrimonas sediminicola]